jgi:hypothetical protein
MMITGALMPNCTKNPVKLKSEIFSDLILTNSNLRNEVIALALSIVILREKYEDQNQRRGRYGSREFKRLRPGQTLDS